MFFPPTFRFSDPSPAPWAGYDNPTRVSRTSVSSAIARILRLGGSDRVPVKTVAAMPANTTYGFVSLRRAVAPECASLGRCVGATEQ